MNDGVGHGLEQRPRLGEIGGAAACHDERLARGRFARRAADGRVHAAQAECGERFAEAVGQGSVAGAHLDDERTGRQGRGRAVVAEQGGLRVRRGRQHGDQDGGIARRVGWRGGDAAAAVGDALGSGGGNVVGGAVEAAPDEISEHRAAHDAEANEGDPARRRTRSAAHRGLDAGDGACAGRRDDAAPRPPFAAPSDAIGGGAVEPRTISSSSTKV